MAHSSTVLSQMLKIVPRHEFNTLAEQHHIGRKLRKMTRWSQFVAMASAQLSGRVSLRDLVHNLDAQIRKLFHLGLNRVTRSSLARVNENQPHELYVTLGSGRATCIKHRTMHVVRPDPWLPLGNLVQIVGVRSIFAQPC